MADELFQHINMTESEFEGLAQTVAVDRDEDNGRQPS